MKLRTQAKIAAYGSMMVAAMVAYELPAGSFALIMIALVFTHVASWVQGTEEQTSKSKGMR